MSRCSLLSSRAVAILLAYSMQGTVAQSNTQLYICGVVGGQPLYQSTPCTSSEPAPAVVRPPPAAQKPPPRTQTPASSPDRDALRANADARRAEETRKREEIQKGFREAGADTVSPAKPSKDQAQSSPTPTSFEPLSRSVAVDRMTTYTTVLGRGLACGAPNTDQVSRRFGAWMDAQGLTKDYLLIAASGIKYAAEQQKAGRSPDSCQSVIRNFASFPWP